jgi:steroid delta-isomerase-like uncharacterized protein
MATSTTSSAAVARATIDALNAHDVTAMRAIWADDVTERFPEATVTGADALAAYFQGLFDAIPDVRMEIRGIAEDGEDVLLRWHLTGTHTGAAFQGVNPTGKSLAIDGMDQMTIRDGRLAANFVVFDRMQFGQQLGMLPPDGSGQEKAMKAAFNARTALRKRFARSR